MATTPAQPVLGLWSSTALVVGSTIGVGIFLTPAELIGAVASPALTFTLWVGCGLLALAGAFSFGELAARYPQAGGPYVYLREGWGPRVAFLYGWQSLLIMDPGITAGLAAGLSQYLAILLPAARGRERWIAVGVIWVLAVANMRGLRLGSRILNAVTLLKVVALASLAPAAFAIGRGSWSHFVPFVGARADAPPIGDALALGLVSVFFSFGGFWDASRIAAEVRNPRRTLGAALALGVIAVMLLYVMTTAAFIFLVPPQQMTSAAAFAQSAGEALLGPAGPPLLAAVVVISVVSSIMALLMMAPRLYVAMSREGLFPASLAKLDAMTGSPIRATALMAALSSAFVLLGTFQDIIAFFICTSIAFVALAAASLFVLRARPTDAGGFRAPGHPVTTALFVLLVAAVVAMVTISRPRQAIAGALLVLAGVPVYSMLAPRGALRSRE